MGWRVAHPCEQGKRQDSTLRLTKERGMALLGDGSRKKARLEWFASVLASPAHYFELYRFPITHKES